MAEQKGDVLTRAPITALKIAAKVGLLGITLGEVLPSGIENTKAAIGNLFSGQER